MAADEINARGGILGGRKIELVVEDDSGTPEKGAAGFRKLATQDEVVAVVGQFHSSVAAGGAGPGRAVQGADLRHPGLGASAFTEKHLNYTLPHPRHRPRPRAALEPLDQGAGLQEASRCIAENTDYGVGLVEDTKKLFASTVAGAELKTIVFDRAVVDLTPQLLEIKSWKPDVVINIGVGTPAYLIIKQACRRRPPARRPRCWSPTTCRRAPEYWKNLGREGQLRLVHRLLPPDHEAHPARARPSARSTASSSRRSRSTARSTATRRSVLIADASTRPRATSRDDLVKALLAGKFEGWNGTISFTRGEGPYWQQWTPPMLIMQYTKPEHAVHRGQDHLPAGVQDRGLDAGQALRCRAWTSTLLSQYVLSGLVIGVIYSLMALGITFIYSIMKMINWAMGEFYMIGSYVQYVLLATVLGWRPLVAGPAAGDGARCSSSALVVQRLLLRPMYVGGIERRDEYATVVTIALMVLFRNLAIVLGGPNQYSPRGLRASRRRC